MIPILKEIAYDEEEDDDEDEDDNDDGDEDEENEEESFLFNPSCLHFSDFFFNFVEFNNIVNFIYSLFIVIRNHVNLYICEKYEKIFVLVKRKTSGLLGTKSNS